MNISGTGEKYIGINKRGREAVRSGAIEAFTGYPESLRSRFNTALLFDKYATTEIGGRVLDRIKALEQKLGCQYTLAGRDFPLHSTLLEATYEGEDINSRDQIFDSLSQDLKVEDPELLRGLAYSEIEFRYLLIDKGNILLTATTIPPQILDVRRDLSSKFGEYGLKPLPLDNMLHITIARMTQLPEDPTVLTNGLYIKQLRHLRHRIVEQPIMAGIEDVRTGPVYQFLTGMSV